MEHLVALGVGSSTATASSEASETSSALGYAKSTWSNSTVGGTRGTPGVGCSGWIIGTEVEHLEDPLEGHERGHDVEVDVGELGERLRRAGPGRR